MELHKFKGQQQAETSTNGENKWKKLSINSYKFNWYTALNTNEMKMGIWFVIRNCEGDVMTSL